MQQNVCKSCGGEVYREGNYYVCRYCGNKWMIDAAEDVHVVDRANAWAALRDCDFEKAEELFENIIFKDRSGHEAYWGRALAKSGIIYVTDLNENKKVPTCNSISEQSFFDSFDVKKAIELAPAEIAENYKAQAEKIEAIRSEWFKRASREKPYDVFICFKDSDREHGIERTDDSYDAHELYSELTNAGYRVFFSRVSLRDKVSEHYEPYIYNALKTAKVMIVFGEKPEYFSAVWLKNEWIRFRNMIERGEKAKNSLVVAYKGFDPSELPAGLRSRQCMNIEGLTFFNDLLAHIESCKKVKLKAVKATAPKEVKPQKVKPEKERSVPSGAGGGSKRPLYIMLLALLLVGAIGFGFAAPSIFGEKADSSETRVETTESVVETTESVVETTETRVETTDASETTSVTETTSESETSEVVTDEVIVDDNASRGLEFISNGDGTCSLSGLGNCTDTDIVIPTISPTGDRVVRIGGNAFSGASTIKSVTIPDSVTGIGSFAFRNCTVLESIVIPDSVTSIGSYAFKGCSSLESITVPFVGESKNGTSNTYFGYIFGATKYEDNDEYVPESLKSVVITGGQSIGENAFYMCVNIKDVVIGEGVKSIGKSAFSYCYGLTSVTIPTSLTSVGGSAFYDCNRLEAVYISDMAAWCNTSFDFNPLLYAKALYLNGELVTELVIPDGITEIKSMAFRNCTSIVSVVIPEGVTRIGANAFLGCEELVSINIPASVKSIGINAFSNCTSLERVYYAEYEEDWEKISIDSGNECLTGAEIVTRHICEFGDWKIVENATCTKDGVQESVCECGEKQTQTIWAEGHKEVVDQAKAATCTETGLTEGKKCSVCGKILVAQKKVEAIGHTEEVIDAVAPTCEETGLTEGKKCSACGEILVAQENVAAIGHSGLKAGEICELCGKEIKASDGLEFTSNGDGTCYVSGIGSCTDANVVIPTVSPEGDMVTMIGDEAFSLCDSFVSITIPDSVTSIGDYAFEWCDNLMSITIPDSVTSIGDSAFSICSSLASVVIGDSVTYIGTDAFSYCYSLKSITVDENNTVYHSAGNCLIETESKTLIAGCKNSIIPTDGSVTSIGDYAFSACKDLTSITIPDSVISIGDGAFSICERLTSVVIGDSVISIGENAFSFCTSLESITVDENNTVYHSVGNCLIETASKTLIAGCKNSIIPTDGSVTSIGDYAFSGCSGITSVVISDSVTSIGEYAFNGCTSLETVYYTGSEEEWAAVGIGLNNSGLTEAEIVYNYVTEGTDKTYSEGLEFTSNGDGTCYVSGIGSCSDTNVVIPTVSPEGYRVTGIGSSAFSYCGGLTSITIPAGVTRIGDFTFEDCSSLMSITIPDSVTSIGEYAFNACDALETVYYTGSEEEWEEISIGVGNSYLKNKTIIYNYVPEE